MDEILLLDAVERYRNNEMGVDEKILFEELRRNNAEVDQRVVEQMAQPAVISSAGQKIKKKAECNNLFNKFL